MGRPLDLRRRLREVQLRPAKLTIGPLLLLALGSALCARHDPTTPEADLHRRLESVRVDFGLPAVAGAYVTSDGRIVSAVTGLRRIDSNDPVSATDLFHLGSVTKPFTGTLAGVLEHAGILQFDDTVGEVLGDLVPDMNVEHRSTTLDQLLRHRAGLQPFEDDAEWKGVPAFEGSVAGKRRQFVQWLLRAPPDRAPGSEHRYSNAGYSVAAVMMEQASGESWEDLMASRVLEPLGIEHFGFGWPVETDHAGTWGHRLRDGVLQPHDPSVDGYRLQDQYIGPAGDLSMDIEGLARFARFHLLGLQGVDGGPLPPDAIARLHAPLAGDEYAIGWNVHPDRSTHLGSAGTAFAAI